MSILSTVIFTADRVRKQDVYTDTTVTKAEKRDYVGAVIVSSV